MEPRFDVVIDNVVNVTKSNNLVTEQILSVYIQVEQPNATFIEATQGVDFFIGAGGSSKLGIIFPKVVIIICNALMFNIVVRTILADVQRITVDIDLFRDNLNVVEGVETFGLTLSVDDGENNEFATFMFGNFSSTLVHISDGRESIATWPGVWHIAASMPDWQTANIHRIAVVD